MLAAVMFAVIILIFLLMLELYYEGTAEKSWRVGSRADPPSNFYSSGLVLTDVIRSGLGPSSQALEQLVAGRTEYRIHRHALSSFSPCSKLSYCA